MTHGEPCTYCDFIGPVVSAEQPVRDFHRNWHEVIRQVNRAFGPLYKAMREMSEAAADARVKTDFTLAGPSKGDSK